ncbi:aminotransferase class V-fold PLP-dependent enzyme [Rhodovarius crocodyli]|uniref:Cysteine desulfurase n=1 Tax=Rhodovarius crocodyli TaxID=1979269 RepID=A0A437MH01_9PROT|nr:aminotransferase class V-fold PLP-dependent enzyme [Rhodovarius crocodyli]RVT96934.1 aminotransferase class V-fold PLP-dependent enzyme [Rhodovarius crocodyli]
MLYLDANATESPRPAATEAAIAAMRAAGNPSSVHAAGRAARRILEDAREAVARAFGGRPADTVLTAGGTEADTLALRGLAAGRRILAGATEHPAVRAIPHTEIPVLPDGRLDLAALEALLAGGDPALVAVMAANNETGVIHPLEDAAALCRAHGALLHVDAVQAAGRIAIPPVWDSLAVSGHKLGAPMGAGALLLRTGLQPAPIITGGGQERGRRGGTEPLPAIAGMGVAAGLAVPDARIGALRDAMEAGLPEGALVVGRAAPRLPNTSCIVLPGISAERQLLVLDQAGICVSSGSACSSGKVARSHVLLAMGLGEQAGQAIRVSLPWDAPEDSAERFLEAYHAMVLRLRR